MCILKCFEEVSGLKVNYNKSKLYGIGVNEEEMMDKARWMRCGIGEYPFTYLGLHIGENMRLCKKLSIVRKVVWRFKREGGSLWVRVIKIIHGVNGGLGDVRPLGEVSARGGDKWRWKLDENGEFTVKELARLVEEKILHTESEGHETLWNKLVPKK
nr:transposon TX1 [Tanacetum cinerariifolium]